MRIGIFTNEQRDLNAEQTNRLRKYLTEKGAQVEFCSSGADADVLRGVASRAKIVVVFGGDGTMLLAVRVCAEFGVPVMGINSGNLGFLTETDPKRMFEAADRLLREDFRIEERHMLRVESEAETYYAVNEITLSRSGNQHTIAVTVEIDQKFAACMTGDGILVCTPTGSTAYSLSCGGPILSPQLAAMAITPMCAHSLHSRPMVVGSDSVIEMKVNGESALANLTVDGEVLMAKRTGLKIRVSKADRTARFIRLEDENFYQRLVQKMYGWNMNQCGGTKECQED